MFHTFVTRRSWTHVRKSQVDHHLVVVCLWVCVCVFSGGSPAHVLASFYSTFCSTVRSIKRQQRREFSRRAPNNVAAHTCTCEAKLGRVDTLTRWEYPKRTRLLDTILFLSLQLRQHREHRIATHDNFFHKFLLLIRLLLFTPRAPTHALSCHDCLKQSRARPGTTRHCTQSWCVPRSPSLLIQSRGRGCE